MRWFRRWRYLPSYRRSSGVAVVAGVAACAAVSERGEHDRVSIGSVGDERARDLERWRRAGFCCFDLVPAASVSVGRARREESGDEVQPAPASAAGVAADNRESWPPQNRYDQTQTSGID